MLQAKGYYKQGGADDNPYNYSVIVVTIGFAATAAVLMGMIAAIVPVVLLIMVMITVAAMHCLLHYMLHTKA